MPTRAAAVLLAIFLAASPLMAQQKSVHSARQKVRHEHKRLEREQVEAIEKQWRQAQLTNNVAAMDKLLSNDYLGINSNGEVVTKTQQLDHMRTRRLLIQKLDISDVKIKLIGPIAIVTSRAQIEGDLDGTPLDGSFRYTRVYQRLPGAIWKITNFEVTRIPKSRHHGEAPPSN